jgi:hypothetical protein
MEKNLWLSCTKRVYLRRESRCASASFNRGVHDMGRSGKHVLMNRVAEIKSLEFSWDQDGGNTWSDGSVSAWGQYSFPWAEQRASILGAHIPGGNRGYGGSLVLAGCHKRSGVCAALRNTNSSQISRSRSSVLYDAPHKMAASATGDHFSGYYFLTELNRRVDDAPWIFRPPRVC